MLACQAACSAALNAQIGSQTVIHTAGHSYTQIKLAHAEWMHSQSCVGDCVAFANF